MLSRRAVSQALRASAPRAAIAPRVAFRAYATPASTKPPIEQFGLDGTYASALYTAAAKTSSLEPTAKALEGLLKVFQADPKLQKIMQAPTLSASDKNSIITELQKHAGGQQADKDGVMKNFFATLAENNRLAVLEGVCERFAELMSAHRGEVELTVTSAAPLDSKVLKQLETAAGKSSYVGQGKKLKVVSKVSPDIRGGLVVEIGDRTIDLSVSGKMARMNKMLRDAL